MDETDPTSTDTKGVETLEVPEPVPAPAPVDRVTEVTPPAVAPDTLLMRAISILVIALLACAAVFHGWRKGYVLAPTDALQLAAPWRTPGTDPVARNEQLLDQTVQFVPWTIYAVDRYRQGQIPLWNPYSQLGVPFLGNGQSAIFYPTILLHLKLPETWSWTIAAALKLFLAGLGAYVLAGRYGLRRVPRLLAGVAFMLCGFNIVWLNHPQTNVICLLPWAILMTEMVLARPVLHRILGATLVFAVQFLGGHPASSVHLILACGMVVVWRLFVAPTPEADRLPRHRHLLKWIGGAAAWILAIAFGFTLAAAQWLPLIEYAHHSGARLVREDRLAHEKAIALDPRYLIGIAFPYANGFPDDVSPFELRRATHLPNTNELAPAFVGTIPLVLAILAIGLLLRRHRPVLMWTIIGGVCAAIAIKFPGIDHLVQKIPALNVAQNGRLLVVTALALAILAGFGLQAMTAVLGAGIDLPRLRRTVTRTACIVAGLAILTFLILLIAKKPILNRGYARAETEYKNSPWHEHSLEHVKGLVRRVHAELLLTSVRLLIPAAMLGLFAVLLWRHRRKEGSTIACAAWPWLLLAVIDLLAFAIPYNPGAPAESYFPSNVAAIEKLKQLPPNRFAGTFRTFMPETSTVYGLADIRGYDALASLRYYKWWTHAGIGNLPDEAQGYLAKLPNPNHAAWSLLNLGYLVTAPDQPAPPADKFKPIDTLPDATIYQATTIRPRAWIAPRAQVYDTIEPVLDRVAKMDFNPDELVLLDRDVAWDSRALADADKSVWSRTGTASTRRAPAVQFLPPLKNEDERPEVIRMEVSGASGGGYLVLADTYLPGWTASVTEPRTGMAKDVPILPAYGVLRAIPLPERAGPVRVELRYRPWSWRVGLMTSASAVCLFILLAGVTILPRRSAVGRAAV